MRQSNKPQELLLDAGAIREIADKARRAEVKHIELHQEALDVLERQVKDG